MEITKARKTVWATGLLASLVAITATVSLQGCTDLGEETFGVIEPDNFFNTESEIIAGLAPVYAQLRGTLGGFHTLSQVSSDETVVPTRGSDWFDNAPLACDSSPDVGREPERSQRGLGRQLHRRRARQWALAKPRSCSRRPRYADRRVARTASLLLLPAHGPLRRGAYRRRRARASTSPTRTTRQRQLRGRRFSTSSGPN